jgi:cytochrome c553
MMRLAGEQYLLLAGQPGLSVGRRASAATCGVEMNIVLRVLAWLLILGLPLAAHSESPGRQEYQAVLRAKPDIAHGEQVFARCAGCHGSFGGGARDGSVPALAAQQFSTIARQLIDFRHDQRWNAYMEHYADVHNLGDVQDLADVAAYISALSPVGPAGIGDGEFVIQGAKTYARFCASCHGAAGAGDNRRGYPRLAGQHYGYLLRQIEDGVEGRRANFDRAHVRLLSRFGQSDFEGLADYLARAGDH